MSTPKYRICDCCGKNIDLPQIYCGEELRRVYIPEFKFGSHKICGNLLITSYVDLSSTRTQIPTNDSCSDGHMQDICDECKLKMLENATNYLKKHIKLQNGKNVVYEKL